MPPPYKLQLYYRRIWRAFQYEFAEEDRLGKWTKKQTKLKRFPSFAAAIRNSNILFREFSERYIGWLFVASKFSVCYNANWKNHWNHIKYIPEYLHQELYVRIVQLRGLLIFGED